MDRNREKLRCLEMCSTVWCTCEKHETDFEKVDIPGALMEFTHAVKRDIGH